MGVAKASVGAYQDSFTIGYDGQDSFTSIKGSAGTSVSVSNKASAGISTEYEHRYETVGKVVMDDDHTTLSTPWSVYNCTNTEKNPFQLNVPLFKPTQGDLSNNSFLIGFSSEAHVIVGCHFTVGWDLGEFYNDIKG